MWFALQGKLRANAFRGVARITNFFFFIISMNRYNNNTQKKARLLQRALQ
jgi:hypothetical protein